MMRIGRSGGRYGGRYGGQYGGPFSSRYGGQYGGYGGQYGQYGDQYGRYGGQYGGYGGRYGGYGGQYLDEKPSLSYRILCVLSDIGMAAKRRKQAKAARPPIRVDNVVYEDCVKKGSYSRYLLEAGEVVE